MFKSLRGMGEFTFLNDLIEYFESFCDMNIDIKIIFVMLKPWSVSFSDYPIPDLPKVGTLKTQEFYNERTV